MTYRLLDTYCRAGGATKGYQRAGFYVVGVDIDPQPHYCGDEFYQSDALEFIAKHWREYDAIHASPVCKGYSQSSLTWRTKGYKYPDQIAGVRELLKSTGKPYVIENVKKAPLVEPFALNGGLFGMNVHRVRYFETNFPVPFVLLPPMIRPVKMGRPVRAGEVIQPVGHFSNMQYASEQMGIDWMVQDEINQAVPPAYTELIGEWLIRYLEAQP